MKTKVKRLSMRTVSLLLSILMLMSVLGFGTLITANAAEVDVAETGAITVTGGYVYFAAPSNWTAAHTQLFIKQGENNKDWCNLSGDMTKLSGTNLYYVSAPNTGWGDLSYIAFIGNASTYGNGGFETTDCANYTQNKTYSLNTGSTYLFAATNNPTNGKNVAISDNYYSAGYSALNKDLTIKTMYSADGSTYAEDNTKYGTFSASNAKKLTAQGTSGNSSVSQTAGTGTLTTARTNTATVSAAAESGYEFAGWKTSKDTSGSGLTTGNYSFTNSGSDATVYAYFKKASVNYIGVTAAVSPAGKATVSPASATTVNSITGTAVSCTSIDSGYTFNNWTSSNGTFASATSASTTFYPTANNATATANLTEKSFDVTFKAGTGGKVNNTTQVTKTGKYYTTTNLSTVTVTANTGYKFNGWTKTGSVTLAGTSSTNAATGTFTAQASGGTITANFTKIDYTLTKNSATGGSFTLDPASTANYQDTVTVTCVPDAGYKVTAVKYGANGTENSASGSGNSWTFSMPAANTKVGVTFAKEDYAITKTVSHSGAGTVTVAKSSGGTGVSTYNIGDTLYPTATTNAGYTLNNFTVTYGDSTTGTVAVGDSFSMANKTGPITVKANYTIKTYTVTYGGKKTDDGSTYSTGGTVTAKITTAGVAGETVNTNVTSGGTVSHNAKVTFSQTAPSGYTFVGWYNAATGGTLLGSNATYVTSAITANQTVYARYSKAFYITAFDSYELKNGTNVIYNAAPPKTITIKRGGSTVVTYTYSGTAPKGNPDTPNLPSGNPGYTLNATGTATYGAGNNITVLAGDEVTMTYSTLSSSDTITGIFYWNGSDSGYGEYEIVAPTVDQFFDHDYTSGHCLYADPSYYMGQTQTTIQGQTYAATVDQNAHSVTWTVAGNYKNIDIELASKKRIVFSDTDDIVVTSETTDNFYSVKQAVTSALKVQAAGDANQTNKIVKNNIKFYYYNDAENTYINAQGAPVTKENRVEIPSGTLTASGSNSQNNGTTAGGNITFATGANGMPAYDIYVDLNLAVSYDIRLDSKILSDLGGSKTKFNQVAKVEAGTLSQAKSAGTPGTVQGPQNVADGDTITLKVTSIDSTYMFSGWYKGTSTGPDYANGFLSKKDTYTFKPTANTYIYAVGTKDLFINGSTGIFGGTKNFGTSNGQASDTMTNHQMEFDPNYSEVRDNVTYQGIYYYEISSTQFAAASNILYVGNTTSDFKKYSNNNVVGNSFFRIYDGQTGQGYTFWEKIGSYQATSDTGVMFGKAYFGYDETTGKRYGNGYIAFRVGDTAAPSGCWTHDATGYDAPIRIYAHPAGYMSVEATPIYSNLYISNGYAVGATARDTNQANASGASVTVQPVYNGNTVTSGKTGYFNVKTEGNGWDPDHEGHVTHIIPEKKNATVRITKTVSSTDKVAAFFVYDIDNDSVYALKNVTASGNSYYVDLTVNLMQNLYIVPIIQEKTADMTVNFDAKQLNRTQWGDIVTCYAWYGTGGNGNEAQGAYPGQPMIPSDDGSTWTATFPSQKSASNHLTGITFTNDVDGNHSWLGCSGVMGTVSYTSVTGGEKINTITGGIINTYNEIHSGTNDEFSRANFKAQTYDYREPVALYENKPAGATDFTITFAMKDGDSSLISWQDADLRCASSAMSGHTILDLPSSWGKLNWEYLTNSTGEKYSDLNGNPMDNHPAAQYYVAAKGQVIYKNNKLQTVFYSGKHYDTGLNRSYSGTTKDMNYAVQWYVYDANGNYITNILSAGLTDKNGAMSLIGKELSDMGYPVDGKSVKICYDKPRYMYYDTSGQGVGINSGTGFDAYRFTGQWYATNTFEEAQIDVRVGMLAENGEPLVLSESNVAGYGSAEAQYDSTKGNPAYSSHTATANDKSWAKTIVADAKNNPIKLNASAQNFKGWYYFDTNTEKFTKATYTSNENFYPSFTKDTTYYAMYEAKATYQYNYVGREGAKSYSVPGGELSDAEMTNGNKVAKTRGDIISKAPGEGVISVWKRTLDFSKKADGSNMSDTNYNNETPYVLNVNDIYNVATDYTLTYYYPETAGGTLTAHSITKKYNETVDLSSANVGSKAPNGQVFMGWYLYDTSKSGDERYTQLLTTQGNYGFVMTKNMTVAARYGSAAPNETGWKVFIDDSEFNRELTTATDGTYYTDAIVRVRNGVDAHATLPNDAETGILYINDGKSGGNITFTNDQLSRIAGGLTDGQKARLGAAGSARYALKFCQTGPSSLTYYNRFDFAVRNDYKTTKGSNYNVYAYVKIGNTYYWSTAPASGTYN